MSMLNRLGFAAILMCILVVLLASNEDTLHGAGIFLMFLGLVGMVLAGLPRGVGE